MPAVHPKGLPGSIGPLHRSDLTSALVDPASPTFEHLRQPLSLGEGKAPIPGLPSEDLLDSSGQINTRLRRCSSAWRALLQDVSVSQRVALLDAIRNGFRLPVHPTAKPFHRPNARSAYQFENFVTSEIAALKALGVLRVVPRAYCKGIMSINVVVQPCGKLRLVVDGTPLNNQTDEPEKFAMEDLTFLAENLPADAQMTKFDVVKLFYHLSLHRKSSPWCCIEWQGVYYTYRAMPMGVSHAPKFATALLRPIVNYLRSTGSANVAQYLDDGLVWQTPSADALTASQSYVHLLYRLGLLLHPEKCEVKPTTSIEFLGFLLETNTAPAPMATLTAKRRRSLAGAAKSIQRRARLGQSVPVRHLASFAGSIQFTVRAFEPAPALLRPLYVAITTSLQRPHATWSTARVQLTEDLHDCCRAIRGMMAANLWTARPLRPPTTPEIVLTTDASDWGWSGYISLPDDQETPTLPPHQARWPAPTTSTPAVPSCTTLLTAAAQILQQPPPPAMFRVAAIVDRAFAREETPPMLPERLHNNVKEMLGLLLSIFCYLPELEDKALICRSDNTTALAALRRGASRSPIVSRLAVGTRLLLASARIQLVNAIHLPGDLNTTADQGSRAWFKHHARLEWPCDSEILSTNLERLSLPLPDIDLFATAANTKCPRYVSLVPDPAALATDAFSLTWTGLSIFANPPFALAARVVHKVLTEKPAYCVLMLPNWTSAPWYQLLDQPHIRRHPLPPEIIQVGPDHNLAEPLTNPSWTINLWIIGSPH